MTTQNQLTEAALLSGESGNPARLLPYLDVVCPVLADFTIQSTPPGLAPHTVREAWIGMSLPVRCEAVGGIAILGSEAVYSLEQARRDEATQWWKNYFREKLNLRVNRSFPEVGEDHPDDIAYLVASMSTLVFNAGCGILKAR